MNFQHKLAQHIPHPIKHRIKRFLQDVQGGSVDLQKQNYAHQQHPLNHNDPVSEAFHKQGPWFSEFLYEGRYYGGTNSYEEDIRIRDFTSWLKPQGRVLELGSFEGAHSLQLASIPGVEEVLGLEGRDYLIEKSKFIARLYQKDSIHFALCDFEVASLKKFGTFDTAFCSGVLYHLTHPWLFLKRLASVSDSVFLATHYAPHPECSRAAYEGKLVPEFGYFEPLSGLDSYAFWLTLDSLEQAAADAGLRVVERRTIPEWANGPWVNMLLIKS